MAPRSGAESSACSSCCRRLTAAVVLVAGLLVPAVARAQGGATDPAAALFDDSVIHDIKLTISSRDWAHRR